ncbi:uncharacterized protein LOC112528240 [Cynara cardunculus var. scolymus]|uniref:uncharacterized protein LOC112528240 n=1 Tax=Cynara cardunculus var. scolymus TaxID=59895 RepID=UPI000D62866C|nr:uncharacterized protein LOC112528240 [Cynara cardunculus var. scolymus]
MDSATVRKQCRLQQNNGLASIAVIEPGFSSSSSSENHRNRSRLISRSLYSFSSIRSGMFFNGRFQEQPPHFLDACFLCKKPLGCNRDIFMYRGDTPFCSEECRAEQIEMDEAKEKKRSFSASIKAMRKKEESEKSSNSSPNYPFRSGAVAAA